MELLVFEKFGSFIVFRRDPDEAGDKSWRRNQAYHSNQDYVRVQVVSSLIDERHWCIEEVLRAEESSNYKEYGIREKKWNEEDELELKPEEEFTPIFAIIDHCHLLRVENPNWSYNNHRV